MRAAPLPPDDEVRALAAEILSRAEYARFRPLSEEWLAELLGALGSFFDWLDALAVTAPALYFAIVAGLLVIALALAAHVVWAVRAALAAGRAEPPAAAAPPRACLEVEARALAAEGRFLEAAHRMHLACLEALIRSGRLELRRHDPNRTLRARLARASLGSASREEFLALLDVLERRWFRDRAPEGADRTLFERWERLHGRLAAGGAA